MYYNHCNENQGHFNLLFFLHLCLYGSLRLRLLAHLLWQPLSPHSRIQLPQRIGLWEYHAPSLLPISPLSHFR